MGGAVVLEVGGGVRVRAVTEGARHASVAGGVVLGVQQPELHDAVEGERRDLGAFIREAD